MTPQMRIPLLAFILFTLVLKTSCESAIDSQSISFQKQKWECDVKVASLCSTGPRTSTAAMPSSLMHTKRANILRNAWESVWPRMSKSNISIASPMTLRKSVGSLQRTTKRRKGCRTARKNNDLDKNYESPKSMSSSFFTNI